MKHNLQFRVSSKSGCSPLHETFEKKTKNAHPNEIFQLNQTITDNPEIEFNRNQKERKFKAIASVLEGHETITVNTEIDLLNEVPFNSAIGVPEGCHETNETDFNRLTSKQKNVVHPWKYYQKRQRG